MINNAERSRRLRYADTEFDEAIKRAVAEAIEERRRLGLSIFIWRDGHVVEVSPEEITPYPPPATEPEGIA